MREHGSLGPACGPRGISDQGRIERADLVAVKVRLQTEVLAIRPTKLERRPILAVRRAREEGHEHWREHACSIRQDWLHERAAKGLPLGGDGLGAADQPEVAGKRLLLQRSEPRLVWASSVSTSMPPMPGSPPRFATSLLSGSRKSFASITIDLNGERRGIGKLAGAASRWQ